MDPSGNDNNSSRDGSNRISTLSKAELQVGYLILYFSSVGGCYCLFVFLYFLLLFPLNQCEPLIFPGGSAWAAVFWPSQG